MKEKELISASIVTYNNRDEAVNICRCLLEHTKKYPIRLYVFDNGSSDGTADKLSGISGVTVVRLNKNIGFGAAHNKILEYEMGDIHFVINPDIIINGDLLSDMYDFLKSNPDIALAMPEILNPDGTVQYLPKEKPSLKRLYLGRLGKFSKKFRRVRDDFIWQGKELTEVTDINFCSGCFFAVRKNIFKELKGFDERYFMYLEDADLTLRAKEKGRVVIAPQFRVTHMWHRESAKSIKYLFIHICSSFKFLYKWRRVSL